MYFISPSKVPVCNELQSGVTHLGHVLSFPGEIMAVRHNHRSLKDSKTPQGSSQRTRNRHLLVVYKLNETD